MKKALEGDNLEEIKKATEELTEIVQQLSVKLYEQAAQQAKRPQGGKAGAGDGGQGKIMS